MATIQRRLDSYHADAALVRQHLTQALDLLEDCHRLYTAAPKHLKKLLNTVFFQQVLLNPDTDEHGNLVLPGSNQPPQDMEDEKASTEDARPGQEPVGQAADHTDADPASQDSAHDPSVEPSGQGEVEWTGDIDDTFASALAPAPILTYDHDSHTSTAAIPTSNNDDAVGTHRPHPDHHASVPVATASQRKTPTPKGERTSLAETAPRADTA